MPIRATINERALRRTFKEHKPGTRGLAVHDIDLPWFGFRVFPDGRKTFFVRASRQSGAKTIVLGTADELSAAEAREKAVAAIAAASAEREIGPLFADFVQDFMRRQERRWKPSTQEGNRHPIDRHLVPFFGAMRVAEIGRAVLPDSKTGPKAIQLPPPARAVLNGLPRQGQFVFPNKRSDGPMKDLGLRWQKLRGLARLDDVRVHDFRHTFASHAVMSGLDLHTVGRLLGHADTASTERYAHLADEHVREAARRISGIVNDAMTGRAKEGGR